VMFLEDYLPHYWCFAPLVSFFVSYFWPHLDFLLTCVIWIGRSLATIICVSNLILLLELTQFPSDLVSRLNSLDSKVVFWARISKSLHRPKLIRIGPSDDPWVCKCWSESCWKLFRICFWMIGVKLYTCLTKMPSCISIWLVSPIAPCLMTAWAFPIDPSSKGISSSE